MKILYGTSNTAKVEHMRFMLKGLPVEIVGLKDVDLGQVEVIEDGDSPLDNATKKAHAYYKAFNMPVFACDSGLYLDGFHDEAQPKVNVRRRHGRKLDDEEMILHYSGLAQNNGGEILAWYENAICLVKDEHQCIGHQDADIASERFIISEKPCQKRRDGFPLDSLSIQVKTGKYYLENDSFREDKEMADGFRHFFIRHLDLSVETEESLYKII